MSYRNPALTVDALVARLRSSSPTTFDVLLIQRGREPFEGCWAFPGGFVDYNEDPETAVTRELLEETCLRSHSSTRPQLVGVRGNPSRDPRQHIVTVGYAVKVDPASLKDLQGGDDAALAKWWPLDEVCETSFPLAFDHGELARTFREWLLKGVRSGVDQGCYVVVDEDLLQGQSV